MNNDKNILKALEYINPAYCSYQEWINVGMALKLEGFDCEVWDNWSRNDVRYKPGECQSKWYSFNGSSSPVTCATIFQMARQNGYNEVYGSELDWDSEISVESDEIPTIKSYSVPAHIQLINYLETLFEASENVGYVTESWDKDGKYLPSKGHCDRTAGQLIEALSKCNGDIGAVFGDYNSKAGAWIRFNPLDGLGVKNENVTDYRYCLVESDNMELSEQRKLIENLRLPVACLVFSGKKSIHAITHVDAANRDEYRKRVEYIYKTCQEAGLKVDVQNKNPSRLSRMPGVKRGDNEQTLLATNLGCDSFLEWEEYIESINDNLPDEESLASVWDDLPELSPPLIHNVLRQGHKMLVAGPSKAGKSFALIELCIAIAEGKKWFGFDCAKGKVLYVNLELDRASCLHRFKDVYKALNLIPDNLSNIDIWNLRGKSTPLDKLAPKLIRRAKQKGYIAVIIDPIYKIITGDENSADQMAAFCNQFDKICTELGTAVIYCHHHSKGSQVGKRTMDRASGSGVFARDPDALLDVSELYIDDSTLKKLENTEVCKCVYTWLKDLGMVADITNDIRYNEIKIREFARNKLDEKNYLKLEAYIDEVRKTAQSMTAWQIDGTLREFAKFKPFNLWFNYPVHILDDSGILKDVNERNSKNSLYGKNFSQNKQSEKKKANIESFEITFEACQENGIADLNDMASSMGVKTKTVRSYVDENFKADFWIENNKIGRKAQ